MKKIQILFKDVNIVINQKDFDCVNVSGFKKLNGNQILAEDISYILNDVKSKLIDTEKYKKQLFIFLTMKYLLDKNQLKIYL